MREISTELTDCFTAEWEKAVRGTDGRKYPWGNTGLDCNHAVQNATGCNNTGTAPVGSKPAGESPYGALDMIGNVLQWTEDWYDGGYYTTSPAQDPQGPPSGTERVLRGGSWYFSDSFYFRASFRTSLDPLYRYDYFGFRCAVSQ